VAVPQTGKAVEGFWPSDVIGQDWAIIFSVKEKKTTNEKNSL
jgi:hypothetical protein